MLASNRMWIIGGVAVIVIVAALALLLGIKPQVDATLAADSDRLNVETQNIAAENTLTTPRTEYEQLDDLKKELATLQKSIPAVTDMGKLTTQMDAAQAKYGVVIKTVTIADAVQFVPTADAAATVPASITADNFTVIPIVVTIAGDPSKMFEFIHSVQTGDRLMLVKGLTVSAENTIDISANVYVLTDAQPSEADPATTEANAAPVN